MAWLAVASGLTAQSMPRQAVQLFTMANQTRAAYGLGRLDWDQQLANAAYQHCLLMARAGTISHQFVGEAELGERAHRAGAHFTLVEENVASGPNAPGLHDAWMHSPGHRANLLNPRIDQVGIAVIAFRGTVYAVADYAKGVDVLSLDEVIETVAGMLSEKGLELIEAALDARTACEQDLPHYTGPHPRMIFRWEDGDVHHLPKELIPHLESGRYRQAAVSSCPPDRTDGPFTVYRMAVLLY